VLLNVKTPLNEARVFNTKPPLNEAKVLEHKEAFVFTSLENIYIYYM